MCTFNALDLQYSHYKKSKHSVALVSAPVTYHVIRYVFDHFCKILKNHQIQSNFSKQAPENDCALLWWAINTTHISVSSKGEIRWRAERHSSTDKMKVFVKPWQRQGGHVAFSLSERRMVIALMAVVCTQRVTLWIDAARGSHSHDRDFWDRNSQSAKVYANCEC